MKHAETPIKRESEYGCKDHIRPMNRSAGDIEVEHKQYQPQSMTGKVKNEKPALNGTEVSTGAPNHVLDMIIQQGMSTKKKTKVPEAITHFRRVNDLWLALAKGLNPGKANDIGILERLEREINLALLAHRNGASTTRLTQKKEDQTDKKERVRPIPFTLNWSTNFDVHRARYKPMPLKSEILITKSSKPIYVNHQPSRKRMAKRIAKEYQQKKRRQAELYANAVSVTSV